MIDALDNLLVRALTPSEGAAEASARLDPFRRVIILHAACHAALLATKDLTALAPAIALGLCAAVALLRGAPSRRLVAITFCVDLVHAGVRFPQVSNHLFLELLVLCALLLFGAGGDEEEGHALASCRILTALVLVVAGAQKVASGLYFRGETLAWLVATEARFAWVFGFVLPGDEVERLTALGPELGDGPFVLDSTVGLALSNGVWIGELALGALLLMRPTRAWAAMAATASLVAIELGAREFVFGLLFLNLLLLSFPRPVGRWGLWLTGVAYGALITARLVWPDWAFN